MTQETQQSDTPHPTLDNTLSIFSDKADRLITVLQEQNTQKKSDIKLKTLWYLMLLVFGVASFAYYLVFLNAFTTGPKKPKGEYISLVSVKGVISDSQDASSKKINYSLNKAFQDEDAKGVIIQINSPGGSPVQSSEIYHHIVRLKEKHNKKVVVVGQDYLTSGAYYIAAAADTIYVDASTITGSIGVIMQHWGLDKVIHELQLEKRVFTAGEHKNRLSPFEPLAREDVDKAHQLLGGLHENFIQDVKTGRGNRLPPNDDALFSGDFWLGKDAVKLGLVDHIGGLYTAMDTEFSVEEFRTYTIQSPFNALLRSIKSEIQTFLLSPEPVFL